MNGYYFNRVLVKSYFIPFNVSYHFCCSINLTNILEITKETDFDYGSYNHKVALLLQVTQRQRKITIFFVENKAK